MNGANAPVAHSRTNDDAHKKTALWKGGLNI